MTATRRAFLGGLSAATMVMATQPLPVVAAPVDPQRARLTSLARLVETLAVAMELFEPEDWADAVAWAAERPPSYLTKVVPLLAEISATDDRLECAAALRAKAAEFRAEAAAR